MPNWLVKATGAKSRETEEAPQEFQLSCECGQVHRGHRKSKSQRIICQTCGAAIFILPRNVYPTLNPQTPKRRRRRRGGARRSERPSLGSLTRGVGRATATAAGAVGRSVHSAGKSVEQAIAHRAMRLAGFVRAQLTPFRLVVLGIVAMLAATGAWVIRSRNLEQAAETLRVEFEAGEQALLQDDAAAAQEHFQLAAAAAETLQSTDTRSLQAKQMLHETTAMNRLTSISLLEMLDEAELAVSGERPELWEDRFRAAFAGTWVILEAPIHLPAGSAASNQVVVDMPLVVGEVDRTVDVIVKVADRDRLELTDQPRQALFAASLTGCELDPSQNRWLVTLTADPGFLWTEPENLRRLGYFESEWVSEKETTELLEAQSQLLGIE